MRVEEEIAGQMEMVEMKERTQTAANAWSRATTA